MKNTSSITKLTATFALLGVLIIASSYAAYWYFAAALIQHSQEHLHDTAAIKSIQIHTLFTTWGNDVDIFIARPTVWKTLSGIGVAQEQPRLNKVITDTMYYQGYSCIVVVDKEMRIVASSATCSLVPVEQAALRTAISTATLVAIPPHLDVAGKIDSHISYGIAHTVFADDDRMKKIVVGGVYFERNVQSDLWPILDFQPVPSASTETLLAMRSNNDIAYLSHLRFKPDVPPLSFRLPITQPTLIQAALTQGKYGLVTGKDYRGVEVLGFVQQIEGTDWMLITKIDRAEIERPAEILGVVMLIAALFLMIFMTITFWLFWYRQSLTALHASEIALKQALCSTIQDISELKRMEEELRKNHDELLCYFQQPFIGMLTASHDKHILHVNQRFCDMVGYTQNELKNIDWGKLTHPDDITPNQAVLDQAIRGEINAYQMYKRYIHKDGHSVHVDLNVQCVRKVDGSPDYFIGMMLDITERKQAEQQLHELSRDFIAFLENTSDFIYFKDHKSRMRFCSQTLANITQHKSWRDMTGKHDFEIFPADTAKIYYEEELPVFEQGQPLLNKIDPYYKEDGSQGWVSTCKWPVLDFDNQKVIGIFGISRDITDYKRAENELQKAKETTARLAFLADQALELANAGHWSIDFSKGNDYYTSSERTVAIFGDPPRDDFRYHIMNDWYVNIEAVDKAAAEATLANYLAAVAGHEPEYNMIHPYKRPSDGKIIWVHVKGHVMRDEQDKPTSVYGVVMNITERKLVELELQQAKIAAETANIAKSAFLANMSHEIRTPMNGILGMAQMLLQPNITDHNRKEYSQIILNSGRLLLNLLNDILDLSKVEAGKIKLESIPCQPKLILNEISLLLAENAKSKGLRLNCKWSGPETHYLSDPYRLQQMLSNLVTNAIKFTEHGQIDVIASEIERNEQTATLEFSITDTGIGIAPDILRLLFTPFSQADSSTTRCFGGSGLGLSIVKSLAKKMGGDVGCESQLGQGSRFWFHIHADIIMTSKTNDKDAADINLLQATIPERFRGQILVAEDDLANIQVIQAMLHQLGLTVKIVHDGQQAVDAVIAGDAANLILMDLHMPILDGYTATGKIRQWEIKTRQPRRPIIALTASVFLTDLQHCLNVGMDGLLAKPIIFDDLKQVLNKWLDAETVVEPNAATSVLSPTVKPVDVPQVLTILRELIPALVQNNFNAVRIFNKLRETLTDTDLAAEIALIANSLAQLQFNVVLKQLRQIITNRGWAE